jgi:hypothetical protein
VNLLYNVRGMTNSVVFINIFLRYENAQIYKFPYCAITYCLSNVHNAKKHKFNYIIIKCYEDWFDVNSICYDWSLVHINDKNPIMLSWRHKICRASKAKFYFYYSISAKYKAIDVYSIKRRHCYSNNTLLSCRFLWSLLNKMLKEGYEDYSY